MSGLGVLPDTRKIPDHPLSAPTPLAVPLHVPLPQQQQKDNGDIQTLYANFRNGVRLSGDKPCLGYRKITRDDDGKPVAATEFTWATYKEIAARVYNFGSGLLAMKLAPVSDEHRGQDLRFVGLYSRNMVPWVIAEQAANAYGLVTVPLYDTLGAEAVSYVVNQTEMATIVCSHKEVATLLGLKSECRTLKTIVVMDGPDAEADREYADAYAAQADRTRGVKVVSFGDVEAAGARNFVEPSDPNPDHVATFCYTSGTTGDPKGAMLSHRNIMCCCVAATDHGVNANPTDVHLSYLPLAHMFERIMQAAMFLGGARIGFYQGDTLKLVDDIITLRPTIFPSVPRLYNRIYDKITSGASGGLKGLLFNAALSAKMAGLKRGYLRHAFWDKLVFSKVGKKVGLDRVRMMVTGSAPIAPHVVNFLRVAFCAPVVEGYGQTESAAAATLTLMDDFTLGHVGGPLNCNRIKLVDVPEMEYMSTDTVHGEGKAAVACRGRGEVCMKGPNVFHGYYKMPDKTREALDADGWLHSGDIGIWTESFALKIVDRKKNIFKLAQGEYVAPEKIENIYQKATLVGQAFAYGDSMQSVLVGLIVPDHDEAAKWGKANGAGDDIEALCGNNDFKGAVMAQLKAVSDEAGLHGFEKVKDITLTPELWTAENDLLTPTFKKKRNILKKHFKEDIDRMYEPFDNIGGKKGIRQG